MRRRADDLLAMDGSARRSRDDLWRAAITSDGALVANYHK